MDPTDLFQVVQDYADKDEAGFSSMHITSEEFIQHVLPAFRAAQWTKLLLCENDLGDEAVRELAVALQGGNSRLGELDLGWNQITDGGLIALTGALPVCLIRELILYSNEISDIGAVHLAGVLGYCNLHTIDLCGNRITDAGAAALAGAIAECPSLQNLDLSENGLTNIGAKLLLAALPRSHLVYLNVQSKADSPYQVSQLLLDEITRIEELVRVDFRIMTTLCSVHTVPRLSSKSLLRLVPLDLIRHVAPMLYELKNVDDLVSD